MKQAMALCLRLVPGVFAILVAAQFAGTPRALAQPLMNEADARAAVERDYGVDVLGIREATTAEGAPAFRVTVMNPGGNYNAAFMVTTLLIDRRSGKLVSQFQHGPHGAQLPPAADRGTETDSGPAMRRETFESLQ